MDKKEEAPGGVRVRLKCGDVLLLAALYLSLPLYLPAPRPLTPLTFLFLELVWSCELREERPFKEKRERRRRVSIIRKRERRRPSSSRPIGEGESEESG